MCLCVYSVELQKLDWFRNFRNQQSFASYLKRHRMAKVHVCNVLVYENPSAFLKPFQFEITFECIEDLKEDLEWKIIYVGSAESEQYDQVLDTILVGPVPEGRHMFVFTADPPNPSKIPIQDLVGVTVVLLTCSYKEKEFIRVGYYVNVDYIDELKENPPATPQYENLVRNILATNPRITRFKINWDDNHNNGDHGVATNQENVPPVGASSSGIANVSNPEDSMGPLKNVQMVANPAAATNSKSEESSMDVN
ncbi:histone chaperone ASF1A-like isoform X2 [Varroa jacobsoni]|uniref:Uncharacterized protein n=1 Tax=Varroa destructor TaxID=109461 RepID=A0A7M7ME97_VARDE|nr:histone chaperone ASF1A-like isoform X2 [Varroa destructor]XP_022686374.1 histone chaperone ASF1A-like isoform X2 [Varroa jacobsoni]